MENIVGLDLSLTCTGIAVYNTTDDGITTKVVKTSSKDSDVCRYSKIHSDTLHEYAFSSIVFIEGYSFGSFSKSSSMSKLIELGGIIKYDLDNRDIPFVIVPPTVLKKFITGKGNAKKEDVKLGVYKKFGREFKTSDEADAFALVVLGIKYLNIPSKYSDHITKIEAACIQTLKGQESDTKIN